MKLETGKLAWCYHKRRSSKYVKTRRSTTVVAMLAIPAANKKGVLVITIALVDNKEVCKRQAQA